jgi:hypothetical protein
MACFWRTPSPSYGFFWHASAVVQPLKELISWHFCSAHLEGVDNAQAWSCVISGDPGPPLPSVTPAARYQGLVLRRSPAHHLRAATVRVGDKRVLPIGPLQGRRYAHWSIARRQRAACGRQYGEARQPAAHAR